MGYLKERKNSLKSRISVAADRTATTLSIAMGGKPQWLLSSTQTDYEEQVSEYRMTDPEKFQNYYDECREIIEREGLYNSLNSFGIREDDRVLEEDDIDRLLTNADLADNPEDVYQWVCDHYHAQPHIGFDDAIRLNELGNYAAKKGYTDVEKETQLILDTKDPLKGLKEELKDISKPSKDDMRENLEAKTRKVKERWRSEIEALSNPENGYDGWIAPSE